MLIINSPLDQFEVINLISINAPLFGGLNLSLTNLGLYSIIVLITLISFHVLGNNDVKLIPSKWSISLESSYASLLSMVREQIGAHYEEYFPFVYSIFSLLSLYNI